MDKDEKEKILNALKRACLLEAKRHVKTEGWAGYATEEEFAAKISSYKWYMRSGLMEGLRDSLEEAEDYGKTNEIDKIQRQVLDETGVDIYQIIGTWAKTAKKVIRAGKVKNDTEFRALVQYRDQLDNTDEDFVKNADTIAKIDDLMGDYETQKMPKAKN